MLLRNLTTSLILYEEIKTTQAKAKEVKPIVEHLLFLAKKNDLTIRRRLLGYLLDKKATKKVFEVLVPRYKDLESGFVHVYKVGNRLGDAAPMVILKLKSINKTLKETDEGKEIRQPGKESKPVLQKPSRSKPKKVGK